MVVLPGVLPWLSGSVGSMQAQSNLRILIVDDHELIRSGMRLLLEDNPHVTTIEEAGCAEQALEMASISAFDIILMDINLPGMSGFEAAGKLLRESPQSRIIMITGNLDAGPIRTLLNAGVRGYISKGSSAEEIEKAISSVLSGDQYLSADVAQRLAMDSIRGNAENPFDKLTAREREIISMLIQGQLNRQISITLHISEKTVSTHRIRAFEKLGIKTPTELARLAIRFGV